MTTDATELQIPPLEAKGEFTVKDILADVEPMRRIFALVKQEACNAGVFGGSDYPLQTLTEVETLGRQLDGNLLVADGAFAEEIDLERRKAIHGAHEFLRITSQDEKTRGACEALSGVNMYGTRVRLELTRLLTPTP